MDEPKFSMEQIELMDIVSERFTPALNLATAQELLTTSAIYQKLKSIYPSSYSEMDVYSILKELGYSFEHISTTKFCWLINTK